MKRHHLLLAALIIAGGLLSGLGAHRAGAAEEAAPTVVELSTMPAQDERGDPLAGQYWISIMLTTADGRYVADRQVQVVEPVEFFGRREAALGTALTDGTGFAAVIYQPSQAGEHTIKARFSGDAQYAPSNQTLTFEATDVVLPFTAEAPPLASVGRGLALFLAILGIAFWAVLLGVLARTVWRIRGAPGAAALAGQSVAGSQRQEVLT